MMVKTRDVAKKRESGLAVATVLLIIGVLTLLGAVGAGLMVGNLRTAGTHRGAARATYCAEAGLVTGRDYLLANIGLVNDFLACNQGRGVCPSGYPVSGSASGSMNQEGGATFEVRFFDNYDEMPPSTENPLSDADLTVVMVSRCTDTTLPPRQVSQHLTFDVTLIPDYRSQAGFGRGRTGNQN